MSTTNRYFAGQSDGSKPAGGRNSGSVAKFRRSGNRNPAGRAFSDVRRTAAFKSNGRQFHRATSQRAFSTSDSYGQEIIVDVHCWAMRQNDGNQSPATGTARRMMARIEAVVHMQPDRSGDRPALTIPGRNLLIAQVVERSQLALDADGETNHAYLTISALIGHG